jgi:hypothetical protein
LNTNHWQDEKKADQDDHPVGLKPGKWSRVFPGELNHSTLRQIGVCRLDGKNFATGNAS